ncbi:uncharacterized protein LOC129688420 [Psammomys obesus]|uniref:uncharacterized protein LOC129688420 n=1 Tax=Psammomys obesus TaxID=48139 RepID=UPI0024534B5C|nr:uncharacterized protein LOC129688420 [Psammomys obesus]
MYEQSGAPVLKDLSGKQAAPRPSHPTGAAGASARPRQEAARASPRRPARARESRPRLLRPHRCAGRPRTPRPPRSAPPGPRPPPPGPRRTAGGSTQRPRTALASPPCRRFLRSEGSPRPQRKSTGAGPSPALRAFAPALPWPV